MTNKEKQIIKELRKIAKYGILTDADGDFTEFYFKDIEELFSKALKSQRKKFVDILKAKKLLYIVNLGVDKKTRDLVINTHNSELDDIINLIKEDE